MEEEEEAIAEVEAEEAVVVEVVEEDPLLLAALPLVDPPRKARIQS